MMISPSLAEPPVPQARLRRVASSPSASFSSARPRTIETGLPFRPLRSSQIRTVPSGRAGDAAAERAVASRELDGVPGVRRRVGTVDERIVVAVGRFSRGSFYSAPVPASCWTFRAVSASGTTSL